MRDAETVILNVLARAKRRVPATKLVKLVYLVDYVYFQHYGETATGLEYQWDHYGPNAVQHGIVDAAEQLAQKCQLTYHRERNAMGSVTKWFSTSSDVAVPVLDDKTNMVVRDVVDQYGTLSVEAITAVSKNTQPFKNASQYDMLVMQQSAPALGTTDDDVQAYLRDIEANGTLTLEEINSEYAV